jgi:Sulfatase
MTAPPEAEARLDEADAQGDIEDAGDAEPAAAPPESPEPRWFVRREALLALEILALTAFIWARPIFGSFGRSPETFVARGADWTDVVAFALLVLLLPPLPVVAGELVLQAVWPPLRRGARFVVVGVLGGLATWQVFGNFVASPRGSGVALAVIGGALLAVAASRLPSVRTFLRYASIGALVLLVEFLVLSPVSSIVFGERHGGVESAAAEHVAAQLGPDAPPVVLVVFDGLPTELLLDGTGHIDADFYPNIAALAGDGTWYRNHTTVAQYTLTAVPAILSGQRPDYGDTPPLVGNYRHNLFTLLGKSYDVHGGEQMTGICPVEMCPEEPGSPLRGLAHDAKDVWEAQMSDVQLDPELVPKAFDARYEKMSRWIAQQDFRRGERPGLYVYHLLLPHPGWNYLPDGTGYAASGRPPGMFLDTWGEWGETVARQRHVLQAQAADRLLGQLIAEMRRDGAYDDALVAVTADHGYAFTQDAPWRALAKGNADQILWTPLIIKSPGQQRGVIDDSNVNATDIVPTIADAIGIDRLPWKTHGEPASEAADRPKGAKWVVDWRYARLRPTGNGHIVHVDGDAYFPKVLAADFVDGSGGLAVWRHTEYGGLVATKVADHEVAKGKSVATVEVEAPDRWQHVDTGYPPLELVGIAMLDGESRVAVAANGTIAAVVSAKPGSFAVSPIHALIWPGALRDGANDVRLYLVDGPASAPVLHPMTMVARS